MSYFLPAGLTSAQTQLLKCIITDPLFQQVSPNNNPSFFQRGQTLSKFCYSNRMEVPGDQTKDNCDGKLSRLDCFFEALDGALHLQTERNSQEVKRALVELARPTFKRILVNYRALEQSAAL